MPCDSALCDSIPCDSILCDSILCDSALCDSILSQSWLSQPAAVTHVCSSLVFVLSWPCRCLVLACLARVCLDLARLAGATRPLRAHAHLRYGARPAFTDSEAVLCTYPLRPEDDINPGLHMHPRRNGRHCLGTAARHSTALDLLHPVLRLLADCLPHLLELFPAHGPATAILQGNPS